MRVERTSESSEEMEEVEELASNRLLDSLIVISSVVETSTREGSAAEDLTASATTRAAAAAVGVVNAARIVRRRAVTVGGRVDELIGEKATERQVGGRETLSSNRLTLKQRKKGGVLQRHFLASRKSKTISIKIFLFGFVLNILQEIGKAPKPGPLARHSSIPEGFGSEGF